MGVPGKDVCWKRYQGFESLPLRTQVNKRNTAREVYFACGIFEKVSNQYLRSPYFWSGGLGTITIAATLTKASS